MHRWQCLPEQDARDVGHRGPVQEFWPVGRRHGADQDVDGAERAPGLGDSRLRLVGIAGIGRDEYDLRAGTVRGDRLPGCFSAFLVACQQGQPPHAGVGEAEGAGQADSGGSPGDDDGGFRIIPDQGSGHGTSGVRQTVYKDYSKRLHSSIRLYLPSRSVGSVMVARAVLKTSYWPAKLARSATSRCARCSTTRRLRCLAAGPGRLRAGRRRPPSVDLRRVRGVRRAGGPGPAGEVRTRRTDSDLGAEQCRVGDPAAGHQPGRHGLVALNPAYRTREMQFVLEQSGAAGLLCADAYRGFDMLGMAEAIRPSLPGLREIVSLSNWDKFLASADPGQVLPQVAPGDMIQVQYTSGTTGFPGRDAASHGPGQRGHVRRRTGRHGRRRSLRQRDADVSHRRRGGDFLRDLG